MKLFPRIIMLIVVIALMGLLDWGIRPLAKAYPGMPLIIRMFCILIVVGFVFETILYSCRVFSRPEGEIDTSLFVGMTHTDLSGRGYKEEARIGYVQEGGDEFISFVPVRGYKDKPVITFYLKNGKVEKWDTDTIEALRAAIRSKQNIKKYF